MIPAYCYTEQFSNNMENYENEGTHWFGIFFAFVSGIFFTISSAFVKGIKSVDPMILLSLRAIVQIIVMLIVVCKESKNILGPRDYRLLNQFQGIVGGMTLTLMFYSFRKLPLGDATTIIFSSPVIVIILSFVFLKEPCGVLRITVMCALVAGVVLVARPPFLFEMHRDQPYDIVGYVCALLATWFNAINIVMMRKCSPIHYSILVLSLSFCDWFTWEMIMMVVVTGLVGQVLVAKALKIEGAGKVSMTRSLDLVLAYIIQIYFFEDIPSNTSILGAVLIFISVICMAFEREVYGICDFIP
ncbi:solute carrier family 35 member G1-like [Nasonia vitripennis]|uniref:EamA domain-containing protein n=1 Tax=Nasonia vitripennis TaxID=7425 RepID=A0A7M7QRP5_NASVI|nr:solute carrier family 35 member G1-like [Nasonia vitripennis]